MTGATTGSLRVGVVGLGSMGRRHARVASIHPRTELAWTVDPVAGPYESEPHHDDLETALAAERPDAVVVAAPTPLHHELASEALRGGVPVLVEKPIAASSDEARELNRRAEESGVLLRVGHVERFNPAVQAVSELLAAGRLGRPISFSFRRVGLPPARPRDADVISDLAVHDLDVLALLCDRPVCVTGATLWPASGLAEAAQLLVQAGHVSATLQVNWRTPTRIREFSLTTDECYVEVNYTTQLVEVVESVRDEQVESFSRFQSHYGELRRTRLEVQSAEPLSLQFEAFVLALEGVAAGRLADGPAGVRAIEQVERARALAAEGAP